MRINRKYILRIVLLLLLLLWAFFPRVLCSEPALLVWGPQGLYSPAQGDTQSTGRVLLRAPLRIDPHAMDRNYSGYVSPGANLSRGGRHYLGTDELGRDTLAGIIYGISSSLRTGILASLLALALALLPALSAGYYASERKQAHFLTALADISIVLLLLWTGYISLLGKTYTALLLPVLLCAGWLLLRGRMRRFCLKRLPFLSFSYSPDALLLRLTDGYELLPKIVLLLVVFAFVAWDTSFLAILLGIAGWPFFFRYLRADTMRLRALPFVRAALLQNVPGYVLALRYFLPSLLPLIFSLLPFMFIAAVLTEASLSFIGLGLDPGAVTLGRMIADGRSFPQAWWLLLFPALALTALMALLYLLGARLSARFAEEK